MASPRKPATIDKPGTTAPAPEALAAAARAGKPSKARKSRLVRDSFTMPEAEYALIDAIKKRCLGQGLAARKSEVLRAALANLARLGDKSVVSAIRRLTPVKTGRPTNNSR